MPPIEAPSGVEYGKGCPLPADYGVGELREHPQQGLGWSAGQKRILAYFEGWQILFAPVFRCFESVKECFLTHLGGKAEVWG